MSSDRKAKLYRRTIVRLLIVVTLVQNITIPYSYASDCLKNLSSASESSGIVPPGGPPGDPPKGYTEFIFEAAKGKCLRDPKNKGALTTALSRIAIVWLFQMVGYAVVVNSRDEQKNKDNPIDFPTGVLVNSALVMWIQNEVACNDLFPKSVDDSSYARASWNRYKNLMWITPFSIFSFVTIANIENAIRYGFDPEHYDHPISKKRFQSTLSDALFIAAFDGIWLNPRLALVQNSFEYKVLPKLTKGIAGDRTLWKYFSNLAASMRNWVNSTAAKAELQVGSRTTVEMMQEQAQSFTKTVSPLLQVYMKESWLLSRSATAFMLEWGLYRVPLSILDSNIFFITRADGLRLPQFKLGSVDIGGMTIYDPNSIAKWIMDHLWMEDSKLAKTPQ